MFEWVLNTSLELPSLTIVLLDVDQSFVSVFNSVYFLNSFLIIKPFVKFDLCPKTPSYIPIIHDLIIL